MLYSINDSTSPVQQLVRIDPTSGLAKSVGPPYGELEYLQGLEFVIPEPSGLAMLTVVGILGIAACSFRRRSNQARTGG